MVTLHISYKDGCAYVAIEEDGKRRQHKIIYKNTDGKEQHAFCAEVAEKVEAELGKPVQWKMAESRSVSSSKLMNVGILVLTIGIVSLCIPTVIRMIGLMLPNNSSSSSYATSSSYESKVPTKTYSSSSSTSSPYDDLTVSQQNALLKALSYLKSSAFSAKGLIEQLQFEGFSKEDATLAVSMCGADWNEQAALKAKSYLKHQAFSHSGLVEQLVFEGFTQEQAEYGVSSTGL